MKSEKMGLQIPAGFAFAPSTRFLCLECGYVGEVKHLIDITPGGFQMILASNHDEGAAARGFACRFNYYRVRLTSGPWAGR